MVRWWQVGLSACKLHSQVTLNAAVTHLAMFDWPSAMGQAVSISLPVERPAGGASGFKRGNTRFSIAKSGDQASAATRRQSVRLAPDDIDNEGSSKSNAGLTRSSLVPVHGGLTGFIRQRKSLGRERASIAQSGQTSGAAAMSPHDDFLVNKDHSCVCVVAFDVAGGMPILLARQGRIAKVYTCNDHFADKGTKVDQLICEAARLRFS